jgi:nucleobase:cation symporter-1, NCS1 family
VTDHERVVTTGMPDLSRRRREYGAKVVAVEPGGAEQIPLAERHGRPVQMLWTWVSPNMEFATIYVGALGLVFGLSFWQSVSAIVIGTAVGAVVHGVLASWGPDSGYCQLVLSRRAFGFRGNVLPAGVNALVAGVGWFAVTSVSGAFALSALLSLDIYLSLVVVVVLALALAFFGHNLIQLFERYMAPLLTVIFVVGGVVLLTRVRLDAPAAGGTPGAWWIMLGASFGYAAGWIPFAADYTRYLPPGAGRAAGIWGAVGVLVSAVLLECFGAAAFAALGGASFTGNPTLGYTSLLPGWLGRLTLLGIVLGAIAANSVNLYSSSMSFAAMGFALRARGLRAAVTVVTAVAAFVVAAIGVDNIDAYENFLLVIAYWVGPWLGVLFADRLLRRPGPDGPDLDDRAHRNPAGPIAFVAAAGLSIALFSDQSFYVGPVPAAVPGIGDLTFEVGFVLAFAGYAALRRLVGPARSGSHRVDRVVTAGRG